MMITKKALPRRAVLRGLGTTIALPFLDSMVPAFAAPRATAAASARRLVAIYVGLGMSMKKWTPPTEGALQLSPILAPMAPFQDRTLVLSGLDNKAADALDLAPHSRIQPAWLAGVLVKRTEGADLRAGITMDQLAANELGRETQLSSLELALETVDTVGSCGWGYSCAYIGTVAWRNATTPLPMEHSPRAVFERLFGGVVTTDRAARVDQIQKDRSLLDGVTESLKDLEKQLGPPDRVKLNQYLEAVRDAERRIQKTEEQLDRELPAVEQPAASVPSSFTDYGKLMFDLLALAFQADLTRVSTLMMVPERSVRQFPEIGVPDAHHPLSHHQNDPEKLEKLAKVNVFHMRMFADFLEKLRSTPDGDGSLLDHTMLLYGSGMSDSQAHSPYDLPTMLVAGSAFQIQGGRHVRYPSGTPMMNLHLTLLDKLGVRVDRLGDSNGQLNLAPGI